MLILCDLSAFFRWFFLVLFHFGAGCFLPVLTHLESLFCSMNNPINSQSTCRRVVYFASSSVFDHWNRMSW